MAPRTDPVRPPTEAPKSRVTAKRNLKREALLAHATRLFNLRGIAATSLADIAEELGLTRASLYYYVDDRDELVFQCYQRACDQTAEDLALASTDATDGFGKVLAFVARATDPARPATAVLSEVPFLGEPHRAAIETASRRNAVRLQDLIEAGIADGSLRPCDARTVAHVLIGILSWAQLSPHWVGGADGRAFRKRVRADFSLLLTKGASVAGACPPCPVEAEIFLPGRFNAFDRAEAAEMKTAQLVATASQLFNRQGIEATSLDDISAALGATKGVVYHYMQDKTDLVLRCYERAFDLFDGFVASAQKAGTDGLSRTIIGVHLNTQAQVGALSPLMPQAGMQALPSQTRLALTRRARALRVRFAGWLRQGMADGSCNPCDVVIRAQIGAGAFGWLPKWITPDDAARPRQLADEITRFFALGLKARTS
ncbi:MAG: hypothetical protein JWR84_2505 [Caulobacter sp.]|nr:hypothetical protein [Caulobacter sp.]